MTDLRRPTLAEFIERAREYDVRCFDVRVRELRTTVLFRPSREDPERYVAIDRATIGQGPLPSEAIVRYCRALGLKPHDFGVFIG